MKVLIVEDEGIIAWDLGAWCSTTGSRLQDSQGRGD